MRSVYLPRVTPMRRARRLKGMTIPHAAAVLAVSAETYRRWEQGEQRPRCPQRVADALGIAREEVMG